MMSSTSASTSTSSNNNSKNKSELEMDSSSIFLKYMEKCYTMPSDLKNDIIYCQRAMRDFLKVHALVSDVFKEQADADPVQMQRILNELEEEVYEINAENQFLMLHLKDDLQLFYKKLQDNGIESVPELANEYISGLLVPLIGDASYKIYPQNVVERDNEQMLIRKHFLLSQDEEDGVSRPPLKLSELDEDIPLIMMDDADKVDVGAAGGVGVDALADPGAAANVNVRGTDINDLFDSASQSEAEQLSILKKLGEVTISAHPKPHSSGGNICGPGLTSEVAVMIVPDKVLKAQRAAVKAAKEQRSLLIPRSTVSGMGAVGGFSCSGGGDDAAQLLEPKVEYQYTRRLTRSPPPLAPISNTQAQDVTTSTNAVVASTSTGAPASPPAYDGVEQSRMNLRQALKRARKTKQQPRLIDDEPSLEVTNAEGTRKIKLNEHVPSPPKPEVKQPIPKASKVQVEVGRKPNAAAISVLGAATGGQPKQHKTRKIRKPEGAGSPPPQTYSPTHLGSTSSSPACTSSDDSNHELYEQQRLSAFWDDEPRETRVKPEEYGQELFLRLFELYTPEVLKKLSQRHSKRKRRTVQNASGIVFHYGQQMPSLDVARLKKQKQAKPEFLLSPKEKRLQAKKASKPAGSGNGSGRKSKSQSPDKVDTTEVSLSSDRANNVKAVITTDVKPKYKDCKKRPDNVLLCESCQVLSYVNCDDDVVGGGATSKGVRPLSLTKCSRCLRDLSSKARPSKPAL